MGGWKLEVGKMALYISFPVVLFYLYNQPKYLSRWIDDMRIELHSHENQNHKKELRALSKALQTKREKELLEELEKNETRG